MSDIMIGIDVGTTALKVIAADREGNILVKSYQEYPVIRLQKNWVEQDMEVVWEVLLQGLAEASHQMTIEQRQSIKAISLSTQRSTMVPVDCFGHPLRYGITWMDGRSGGECEELAQQFGKSRVYKSTGNPVSTIWTMSYILWLKRHEQLLYEETYCFANVHSYLMKRLGSSDFYLDYSNAGETMMLDPHCCRWNKSLLAYTGLEEYRLPKLVPSGRIIGTVSDRLSRLLNFPQTVKLVAGGGDQQCAALGGSAAEEGDVSIGMGTAANILALSDRFLLDKNALLTVTPATIPGKYFLEGSLIACGPILNWIRDLAYGKELAEIGKGDIYDLMNREAASCSAIGANGVLLVPHFQGAGCPYWDQSATGILTGITLSTTRADLVRAVMEGLAVEVSKCLLLLQENGMKPKRIILTGGAGKSDIWCQIQADVYGLPLSVPENPDVAAVGALILAALGAKIISSYEEGIERYSGRKRVYTPDAGKYEFYQRLAARSHAVYNGVKE